MRVAILALTAPGTKLALRLANEDAQDRVDIYVSARLFSTQIENENLSNGRIWRFTKVKDALQEAFSVFDAVVCIMATGIVVRSLAPLLTDKLHDPAVIVFDEQGRHGISLLSGHLGGANALTRRLCSYIGADPVITTATDTEGLWAPDAIAERIKLRPYPKERILMVNRALLDGAQVVWQIDQAMRHAQFYRQKLKDYRQQVEAVDNFSAVPNALVAAVSDRRRELPKGVALFMQPQRLIAGVGCRKNVPAKLVHQALQQAAERIGVEESRIDCLASTEHKAQEQGLLQVASELAIPCRFYSDETLAAIIEKFHLPESAFVQKTLGIGNVCEAAALAELNGNSGRFALVKTKFEKVTVALLWEK